MGNGKHGRVGAAWVVLIGVGFFLGAGDARAADGPDVAVDAAARGKGAWSITKSDVEEYASAMFSTANWGGLARRDGKIHKWTGPIKIHIDWPRCEAVMGDVYAKFSENTGINIIYEAGPNWDMTTSIVVIGVNGSDDVRRAKPLYDWMAEYVFRSVDVLNARLNGLDSENSILTSRHGDGLKYRKIEFILNIVSEKWATPDYCKDVSKYVFGQIANATIASRSSDLTDLDYLYASALYDPSVLVDEDERTAQPKILGLMLDKFERMK